MKLHLICLPYTLSSCLSLSDNYHCEKLFLWKQVNSLLVMPEQRYKEKGFTSCADTCLKYVTETLEQGTLTLFYCFYCWLWTKPIGKAFLLSNFVSVLIVNITLGVVKK